MNGNFGRFLAASAALAVLAACGSEPEAPAEPAEETELLAANPDMPAGIQIPEGAWLSLPAVPGNPGAVYFSVINSSNSDATVVGVDISGAGNAMLHRTVMTEGMASMADMEELIVPAGKTVSLRPGEMHVMAMDLNPELVEGGETEATLIFANGDKASFPVIIRGAGDQGT